MIAILLPSPPWCVVKPSPLTYPHLKILYLPAEGHGLHDISLTDENILAEILFDPRRIHSPIKNTWLKPGPRLVAQILSYNIIPKTGSFHHISRDLVCLLYGIYAQLFINWASVVFFRMVNHSHLRFLPFGSFITTILQNFHIPLEDQPHRLQPDLFDSAVVHRMRLEAKHAADSPPPADDPIQAIPSDDEGEDHDDEDEEFSSDFQEDMYASIHDLQLGHTKLLANQEAMMASQATLLQSQENLQHSQANLQQAFDNLSLTQNEMFDFLRSHFP